MVLQMFMDGKLIDQTPLSSYKMDDEQERAWYIQGAIHELLEKWDDVIRESNVEPKFYITDKHTFM